MGICCGLSSSVSASCLWEADAACAFGTTTDGMPTVPLKSSSYAVCPALLHTVTPERRLSYLNAGEHDIIRSVFFNPCDNSVLAVSCHTTDRAFPSQLHCRSVPADQRYVSTCRTGSLLPNNELLCSPAACFAYVLCCLCYDCLTLLGKPLLYRQPCQHVIAAP